MQSPPPPKCRRDVIGNMKLSYSFLAGSIPVACLGADVAWVQMWCNWQHKGMVSPNFGFNSRLLLFNNAGVM